MKLIKELSQLTEAKANVDASIKYIESLGLKVDPSPLTNVDGEIVFKILGMTGSEAFAQLDSVSFLDDLDTSDPNYKIFAGQGLGTGEGFWYDKHSKNFSKEIYLQNNGPTISLIDNPEAEA